MGKIQYLVVQELPAPAGKGRKVSLGTVQISASLEAALEAVFPSPAPTPTPTVTPTPTPVQTSFPAGTIFVNPGDKLQQKCDTLKPGGTIALARGGTWAEPMAFGSAQTVGVHITSFGAGPLPIVKAQFGLMLYGGEHIAVDGIHFLSVANPTGNGVNVICNGINGLTFINNIVQGFRDNVVIQAYAGDGAALADYHKNVLIGNNLILDSGGTGQRDGQGIYVQNVNGLTVQENLIDLAGMNRKSAAGVPQYDEYTHGMYLQHGNKDVNVLRNVVSRCESYGIQTRGPDETAPGDDTTSDPGHAVTDNIIVNCAIGFANSGKNGTGTGNYFLPGHFHGPNVHHGQGMAIIHVGAGDFSNNTRLTGPPPNAATADWVMPFLQVAPDTKDAANPWHWTNPTNAKAIGRDYTAGSVRVSPDLATPIATYRALVLAGTVGWEIGQLRDSLAATIEAAIAAANRLAATK